MILPEGPFAGLKAGGYSVITADPPWDFKTYSRKGRVKTPHVHYRCMNLGDIMALPVADLAAKDSVLFLWTTGPHARQAFDVLDAWGFTYKTQAVWAKQSSTGKKWAFGTGYIMRGAAEFLLVATKGKPKALSKSVRNLIVAPVREHSRKPDVARDAFEALYPGPYLELFSRQSTPGWDAWGHETGKFDRTDVPDHGYVCNELEAA